MSKKVPPTIVSSAKPSRSLARPPRLSPALLVSLFVLFCSLSQFLLLSLFLSSFFSFHRIVAPLQPPLPRTHTAPKAAHIGGRFSLPVPRFFRSVFSCELHARVPSVKIGFRVVHSSDSTAARNRTNSAGIKKTTSLRNLDSRETGESHCSRCTIDCRGTSANSNLWFFKLISFYRHIFFSMIFLCPFINGGDSVEQVSYETEEKGKTKSKTLYFISVFQTIIDRYVISVKSSCVGE